jgi:hypothetical protein
MSKADLVALRLIARIRRRKVEFLAMRADCWHDVGRELTSTSPVTCSAIRVELTFQVMSKLFSIDISTTEIIVSYVLF